MLTATKMHREIKAISRMDVLRGVIRLATVVYRTSAIVMHDSFHMWVCSTHAPTINTYFLRQEAT